MKKEGGWGRNGRQEIEKNEGNWKEKKKSKVKTEVFHFF